ncbi:3-isopropylmalate dehydratase [Actinomadura alba]|uniref:3-isopropylmalate dehydratase small subunit n=1 Tax=Actinomadura alba TaxID=406431 RepID=A0ABR7LKH7_9ACTN|nr:3-isopropylmalate dehydratase [Actinomadura alba]MBC6465089.1 3-isopropylmalate dehydratase [Actinomadura alba]
MATEHRVGGTCITFGDDVNTDVIIPGRYLVSIDPAELAEHAFEPLGPEVQRRLRASSVVVAGRNFGCGSAREQASTCLIGAGITAVVAASFSRVFFRNAINTGLVAVESPEAVTAVQDGGEVWVDYAAGVVEVGDERFRFAPYPEALRTILEAGGLIAYLTEQASKGASSKASSEASSKASSKASSTEETVR